MAHFAPLMDGYFAFARHDRTTAADKFADSVTFARAHILDASPGSFTDCVRALVLTGDTARAGTFRDLDASTDSVQCAAHARNIAGLLEPDPAMSRGNVAGGGRRRLDEQHASYEPMQAQLFWRALLQADRLMKEFQTGFVGKVSPVHLFWGGLDLATSRYSGRRAPLHPGGVPNITDWVNEEAYSREEFAMGWWPSSDPPGPAFYSYTYPEPDGIRIADIRPAQASWDERIGEFTLTHDAVRAAADPDAAVLDFFQSTYEAGANLAGWDRALLEPRELPTRPPKRPWSIMR